MAKSRNDIAQNPDELSLLYDLPLELVVLTPSFVEPQKEATKTRVALAKTCWYLYGLFQSDIEKDAVAQALHHAAYARKEDVDKLIAMLENNPRLLLKAGNVITPGGLDVRDVTIYEFLLGAGDPELAQKVQPYFSKIENGENERNRQYERYRPHIEGMLTQEPYDLTPLIEMIKQAPAGDVTALLNKVEHESVLRDAFIQFRNAHAPRMLIEPCMHYNYASLKHAFHLLNYEWDNLYHASGNNYDKIRLVWRQLIGFEMRRLPGVDRCTMAQGLYYVLDKNEPLARTYKFKKDDGDFPLSLSDNSRGGLGDDWAIDIFLGRRWRVRWGGGRGHVVASLMENLCRAYSGERERRF